MATNAKHHLPPPLHLFLLLLLLAHTASSQPFIGVNYGEVADNLPPPASTAKLLQSTTISKLRLYGVDPPLLQALAGTGIAVVVGAPNAAIPSLASDPSAAAAWLSSNVLPFHPATPISTVSVGNEVLLSGDPALTSQLVSAMENLRAALASRSLDSQIKVSTVHSMAVLQRSEPPSSASFDPAQEGTLKAVLGFLDRTGGPFMVNPYPYFAYQSDPTPETLAFCLFQPNQGRLDQGSGIRYTNMFDAQVDAVRAALNGAGFAGVEIVVAETGWPYKGDSTEAGATVENAKAYNGGLIAHLRSLVGTPLMPGKSVDTYLFALYDEDLKPGPTSERSFGLYKPDLTPTYDIDLAKTATQQSLPPPPTTTTTSQVSPPPAPDPKKKPSPGPPPPTGWCVPKVGVLDEQLQANVDYACSQPGVDCRPIQPGGPCYEPNTVASHAAYAMNVLYQSSEKRPWTCDFRQTAAISPANPSYGACVYPGNEKDFKNNMFAGVP